MRKVWSQLGVESPWNYEINLMAEQGMDPYRAKCHVIMEWMKAGDPRPLLATIKENGGLRAPVLTLLAQMIETGELAFKGKGRGRRPDPEAAARNQFVAETYEDFLKHYRVGSDALFGAVARVTGVSVESVRQAVATRRTKSKPKTK